MKNKNKVIAKFMGYSQSHPDYPNTTYWYKKNMLPLAILLYHSSWDCLMPVIDEIDRIIHENEGSNLFNEWLGCVNDAICSRDIEVVYVFVVDFIKWYNKNILK